MIRNFSMKSSESRTAMWAARPMSALVLLGNAWWMSNRAKVQCSAPRLTIGEIILWTISLYAEPK